MRIIGILLVQNEDLVVERAVLNCLDFCDQVIAVDNASTDNTGKVLYSLRERFANKITLHKADHPSVSHELLRPFVGSNTWVFGVDGDEIYDPQGLKRFRVRLESGEFDQHWAVFGNVLNVEHLDFEAKQAKGYLAPPCRSMTKFYNFAAIDAWDGPCIERLHGGRIKFREGFHEHSRCELHRQTSWEAADFRCLHLCFLRRSSREPLQPKPRKNIMDKYTWSLENIMTRFRHFFGWQRSVDEKYKKYGRGPLITKSTGDFFPEALNWNVFAES